ncbi:hypothetical protein Fcan01_26566 [Folsomia candida]|uniref:Uncharacterized protein n=1 Tax=Folsomia candida TaxID=158441 RepID=A0A226D0G5_FOLCA|nr:hypothetical protein Fcan01_26566 [Folsomia candida]
MLSTFRRSTGFLSRICGPTEALKQSGRELVSPEMWILLNLYRNVFVKFSMMPFSFEISERVIHVDRLTRRKRLVSKCWSVLGPLHSLICFYLLSNMVSGSKLKSYDVLDILRPVACMYLGILPLTMMGMSYTISFCPQVAPSIVNCIPRLEEKFSELANTVCRRRPTVSNPHLEALIYIGIFAAPLAMMVLVPSAVVLNLDPLNIFFSTTCKDCVARMVTFYMTRILILTLLCVEIVKAGLAFLIVGMIVLLAASEGACKLDNCIKSGTVSKLGILRLYQELQIWNQHTNILFCYKAIPPLLFLGLIIVIFVNYATIKLFGVLPGMIYPAAPASSLGAAVLFMTLLPQAAKTHDNSSLFLASVKNYVIGKYERKVGYSLRPIGARCGPFGIIRYEWVSKFVETDLNYTLTALLTFR